MEINEITQAIIGAAIDVHRTLGPGLLESAYKECLCRELELKHLQFEKEKALPLEYKGLRLEQGYRVDILVFNRVVIEVKAVRDFTPCSRSTVDDLHASRRLARRLAH
jgi:GxxExxY protein